MKIEGACHCGYITFEAEVDPAEATICHCTDCQQLSGSPFRASVPALPGEFTLLSGEPAVYIKTGESGARRVQAFCPKCGSPIYSTAFDDLEASYSIRLGVVRQRNELVPREQIWTKSELSWVRDLASIPAATKE